MDFEYSIMPTIAFAMFPLAIAARFMRTEMIDVLGSDYITLAKAKGASGFEVAFKHGLRNALNSSYYGNWSINGIVNDRITCY